MGNLEEELTSEEVKETMLNRKERRQLAKHKKVQQNKMNAAMKGREEILEAGNKYSSQTVDYALFNYILTVKSFGHCSTAADSLRTMFEYLWPTIARLTNQSMFMEKLIEDADIDMSEEELEMWNTIKSANTDMIEESTKALQIQKDSVSRKKSNFSNKIMS